MKKPDIKQKFELQGFDTAQGTPEDLAKSIAFEVQRYGKIVRELGISID